MRLRDGLAKNSLTAWIGCLLIELCLKRYIKHKFKIMDWLHIVAVVALIVIGVVIYINKRNG